MGTIIITIMGEGEDMVVEGELIVFVVVVRIQLHKL
jgi:hypothetical protein